MSKGLADAQGCELHLERPNRSTTEKDHRSSGVSAWSDELLPYLRKLPLWSMVVV